MPTVLNKETMTQIEARIMRLEADLKPLWGIMSVTEMLAHCNAAMKMGLGDLNMKVRLSPFKSAMAWLVYGRLKPFSRSLPTAPELDTRKKLKTHSSFEEERTALIQLLQRLVATPADYRFGSHPFFRQLSRKQWGQLSYKHIDHHLRQFGV